MAKTDALAEAASRFGAALKPKLSGRIVSGAPEDQLRGPFEQFLLDVAVVLGFTPAGVVVVGETTMTDLRSRPDFAVLRQNALAGFVELKAPGKGADPRRFRDPHDREQWDRLRHLPNLMYTDGNSFSVWHDGVLHGEIVHLEGDVETSGAALRAPASLLRLLSDFLGWNPVPPKTPAELARLTAGLCRLLRDEVSEQIGRGNPTLTNLAQDWRKLLFPSATDDEFADGYAQAVTFGLLMARAKGIPLNQNLSAVAEKLAAAESLIGGALRVLTGESESRATLKTSLDTLVRVLDVIDWARISRGDPDAWLYFYELFLSVYDSRLRRATGSYYTPPEVVTAMTRLVDAVLRDPARFARPLGLAASDVSLADPAMGTGTFLLGVLRRIAATAEADGGAGTVPATIRAAVQRMIGFEMQFGPFVVAELRLLAELNELLGTMAPGAALPKPRLHITDTLGNPNEKDEWIPSLLMAVAESRRQANEIKRAEPIFVVLGNPPYKEKAKGHGGWVESGSETAKAPLAEWFPPAAWGVSTHAKHLRNLYVYFWRWATWKVFGGGSSGMGAGPSGERMGIVCFISVAGFLNGPGFQKMRTDLRRNSSEIWVIDGSPEGHQPAVSDRIFQGVQQPVCIVLAARYAGCDAERPAQVRFRALPAGRREDKFAALADLTLDGSGWTEAPSDWRAPFLPAAAGAWARYPTLDRFFVYNGSGVMPGRTWVIAPDPATLRRRWDVLVAERDPTRKEVLFHPHGSPENPGDRSTVKVIAEGLHGQTARPLSVAADKGRVMPPVRYGFRSFDRQWIIPDNRLLNRPNPTLWQGYSKDQVYLTALLQHAPTSGPAITFTALIPDLHHYKGSFGGRAFPLWADAEAREPNIAPNLLALLARIYRKPVSAADVMAYLAAIAAHPAYTTRFAADLVQPGLRIPLTADPSLFAEAAGLGAEVIWLHCFGERYADPAAGRPSAPPRLPTAAPIIPAEGAIPDTAAATPDEIAYDPTRRRLRIGDGYVDNVPPAVWTYEVSGKQVLPQWFSYRRRDRSRPLIGDRRPPSPLGEIQPDAWQADYTTELLNLLHVLGRLLALEPIQATLLERICAGPLIGPELLAGPAIRPRRSRLRDVRQDALPE